MTAAPRTVAVMNQKGGVGKTTTSAHLGHALARAGQRVLLLDLDPQGHLGPALGRFERGLPGMDRVLLDGAPLATVTREARERLWLVPAGRRLADLERLGDGGVERGWRLRAALRAAADYDYVLIDCPPAAGLLVVNALFAVDEVVVPVPGDYFALYGLSDMRQLIDGIGQLAGRTLQTWVAISRFHPRRRIGRQVLARVREAFPGQVLATPVRESAALAEAPSLGQTVFELARRGSGALDYRRLASDLMNRRTL